MLTFRLVRLGLSMTVLLASALLAPSAARTAGSQAGGTTIHRMDRSSSNGSTTLAGALVVTPRRLGSIRIGMNLQDALATGLFVADPDEQCGDLANLVARYERDIFVDWKDDVIFSILVKGQARTRGGVRVGSAVSRLRATQPLLRGPRLVEGDGGLRWIQFTRRGRDWLVFGLDTPSDRSPRGRDRIEFMYVQNSWSTEQGLFGGC